MYNMQLTPGSEYRGMIVKGLNNIIKNNIIADSPDCIGALVPSSSTDPVGNLTFLSNIIKNAGDLMYDMYGPTSVVYKSNLNTFSSNNNQYLVYRNTAQNVEDLRQGTYTGTYDQNTIEEDPKFIESYPNDYRLKYDSPARAMGNKDIDIGSIGLTSAYLYTDTNDNIDKVYITNSKTNYEPNIDLNISEEITLTTYIRTLNGYYLDSTSADTINITSDNTNVASVSGNIITGVAKGIAGITVEVTKNSIIKSSKIYVLVADNFNSVTIRAPYSKITASWNGTEKTRLIPFIRSELGRIIPSDDAIIIFSSSDTSKATVSNDGYLTVLDTGVVTITANVTYNGTVKTGSLNIQVLIDDYFDHVNTIKNGDMETDSSLWTTSCNSGVTINKSYDNTTFETGTRSMKLVIANASVNGAQNRAVLQQNNISVVNGKKYSLEIAHKSNPNLQYWIWGASGLSISIAPTTNSTWTKYTTKASASANSAILQFFLGRNNGTYWFDDIAMYRLNNYRCPDAPTNVQVIDNSTSLSISWTASVNTDVQGYNVYINGIKDNSSLITNVSYTATVANNLNYYIQVTSIDSENNESLQTSSTEINRL